MKTHKIPMNAVCGFYIETGEKATFSAYADRAQKRNCLYKPKS